jgi:hypothetical protein
MELLYEEKTKHGSYRNVNQRSSPMLTFPIDAVPVSGEFLIADTFTQTPQKEQPKWSLHQYTANDLGKTGCFKATSELCLYER